MSIAEQSTLNGIAKPETKVCAQCREAKPFALAYCLIALTCVGKE